MRLNNKEFLFIKEIELYKNYKIIKSYQIILDLFFLPGIKRHGIIMEENTKF